MPELPLRRIQLRYGEATKENHQPRRRRSLNLHTIGPWEHGRGTRTGGVATMPAQFTRPPSVRALALFCQRVDGNVLFLPVLEVRISSPKAAVPIRSRQCHIAMSRPRLEHDVT